MKIQALRLSGDLSVQAERGILSGQSRLANAALEGIHVLAMHAADVQLQQGHYTPNLENPEGAAGLFVVTDQADSLQQVYAHLAQVRRSNAGARCAALSMLMSVCTHHGHLCKCISYPCA